MVANAQARPPLVSERLWAQVINDNPDPTKYLPHSRDSLIVAPRMVPVLANGFGDLTMRRSWQNEHQTAQRSKMAELEQSLNSLLTRQDLDVSTQLQVIQKQQLRLTLRVLQLMRRVEVLRKNGVRLSGTEQNLLGRLQGLADQLQQGATHSNSIQQMALQLQTLVESGRLDPLASARHSVIADPESTSILLSV